MDTKNCSGHRKRLRDRVRLAGLDSLHEYEVLELLLFYAIPRKDSKSIAKNLIKRFGSFSAVVEASREDLKEVDGIGDNTAFFISLLKETAGYYDKNKNPPLKIIKSAEDAREYLASLLRPLEKEAFVCLFLSPDNELLGIKKLFEGTLREAAVYPREIAKEAIRLKASGVIFSHNHIGINAEPSESDRKLTVSLSSALGSIDVNVLDHIIVSRSGIYSFAENGLMRK